MAFMTSTMGPFGGGGLRRCSFCGRRAEAVEHLVRARQAYICERCVTQAQETIASAPSDLRLLRFRPAAVPAADRDAADQAIEEAYYTLFDSERPVAERCQAVERGGNLAGTMEEAATRHPVAHQHMDVTVEHIRWLSEDEAEVHFALFSDAGAVLSSRIGHAVQVGDGWKVSRETWCGLVSLVGVRCPPPDPED